MFQLCAKECCGDVTVAGGSMPADDTIPIAPQSAHRLRLSSAKILIKPSEPTQSSLFYRLTFQPTLLLDRCSSLPLTLGEKVRSEESKRMRGSEQEEHMGGNNAIALHAS